MEITPIRFQNQIIETENNANANWNSFKYPKEILEVAHVSPNTHHVPFLILNIQQMELKDKHIVQKEAYTFAQIYQTFQFVLV